MTLIDLKYHLLNKDSRITFGVLDTNLLLPFEKLLLDNGWTWRGLDGNESYLKYKHYDSIIIYSNDNLDEPLRLCCYSNPPIHVLNNSDIILTKEILKEIEFILKPVPNYKPKKFSREI
jgi:hypothetical protein